MKHTNEAGKVKVSNAAEKIYDYVRKLPTFDTYRDHKVGVIRNIINSETGLPELKAERKRLRKALKEIIAKLHSLPLDRNSVVIVTIARTALATPEPESGEKEKEG